MPGWLLFKNHPRNTCLSRRQTGQRSLREPENQFWVAAILSSIFVSQSISANMEMLQRQADQRESHVFSTAGRSEVLPANSVPEAPQRSMRQWTAALSGCFHKGQRPSIRPFTSSQIRRICFACSSPNTSLLLNTSYLRSHLTRRRTSPSSAVFHIHENV